MTATMTCTSQGLGVGQVANRGRNALAAGELRNCDYSLVSKGMHERMEELCSFTYRSS